MAIGFALAVVLLALIGALSFRNTHRLLEATRWVDHTQEVLGHLANVRNAVLEAQTGRRGFVITHDQHQLEAYGKAARSFGPELDALTSIMADNPDQEKRLAVLRPLVVARFALLAESIDLARRRPEDMAAQIDLTVKGKDGSDAVLGAIGELQAEESRLLLERRAAAESSTRRTFVTYVVGFVASVALLTLVFVLLQKEVSERRRAEAELEKLSQELARRVVEVETVNKELEAFSYSVSHDLRAPLRAMDGFSQAILEDYGPALDEAGRGHLGRIRAAATRMGSLINALLDLARVTRAEMKRRRVDLSEIAAGVVADLRKAEPERAVEVEIAPGLVADGDPPLLHVVLTNLLGNAWKFTGKTAAPRVVFGADGTRDGRRVLFVRDNGAGFDMGHAEKLFDAFQRLHGTADFPGTGIGLAAVQRIIRRHGGLIWADATPGQGATFYFTV